MEEREKEDTMKLQNTVQTASAHVGIRHKARLTILLACTLGVTTAHSQTLWTSNYANAQGWVQPQHGTTIMLGDVNGDGRDDVCGRGITGIWCSFSNSNSFGAPVLATNDFADVNGWNNISYYSSIRLADVNGDNHADICGRGISGISCGISNGAGFAPALLWTAQYKSAEGWSQHQYGSTIMFGDINGDGRDDVCGRGIAGIFCSLSTGFAFVPAVLASNIYSDANGWTEIVYYERYGWPT